MNSRYNIPARPSDRRPANLARIVVSAIFAVLAVLLFAATMFNRELPGFPGTWFSDAPAQISDTATVEQPSNDFGARS
jgi:hypothetical protein